MDDELKIRRALELAERGWGRTSPNPMVGCVIASPDGTIVGEGWHEGAGTAHAEVMALSEAGQAARGAALYCSLEPCDHFGRTGPCTEAIVAAGVARVVLGAVDPNPVVNGKGIAALRKAGIRVDAGVLVPEAERLIEAYSRHVTSGSPFVTLKMAASLDGKSAARDGSATWITGEAARAEVHRRRAGSDAIVVGSGTVVADDPHLTVRMPGYRGEPVLRVVVDSRGRLRPSGHLFDGTAPTLMATTEAADTATQDAWRAAGADVAVIDSGADGRVDLEALMRLLGKRDAQSVLVEGGPTLGDAAVRAGIVDKMVLYLAPRLIGGVDAPGILDGHGAATLGDAVELGPLMLRRIGDDLEVEAYVHRDR